MKFINNGLKYLKNFKYFIKENPIIYDRNLYSGLELGIPLSIFEYTFTYNHFGFNIVDLKDFLLLSLIGYVTYGCDRYLDHIDYYNNNEIIQINDNKKTLFEFFKKNNYDVLRTLFFSYFFLNLFFWQNEKITFFLPFIYSTLYYKQIKLNIPCFKPLFVASLWTTASVIIPSILYENNYDIIFDFNTYVPAYFSLLGLSNFGDIKDIEEDKKYNYLTIPNVLGINNAKIISIICLLLSSYLYYENKHFGERLIFDYIFILQNLSLIIPIFLKNNDNNDNNIDEIF